MPALFVVVEANGWKIAEKEKRICRHSVHGAYPLFLSASIPNGRDSGGGGITFS